MSEGDWMQFGNKGGSIARLFRLAGRTSWPYVLLLPTVALLFAFTLYPLLQGLWMSMFRRGLVVVPQVPESIPTFVGLNNYVQLLADKGFVTSLLRTVLFVVVAVPLQLIASLSLALLLAPQTRFNAVARTIVFFPSMISGLIIGVIWAWLFARNSGLVNYGLSLFGLPAVPWLEQDQLAQAAVVVAWVWGGAGFNMMILIAGLTAIPKDLYEAAAVDGTSRWRTFTRITLPLLEPSIVVVVVLGVIGAFQVYEIVVSLTTGGPGRATVFLVQNIYDTAFKRPDQAGLAAAQSGVLFVILMVLTILQLRVAKRR
ncbi:MAG: sugar ABC transporter permease [Gammaproteobacteria bacterium]